MIFAAGALLSQEELPALLDSLEERLNETRSGPPLDVDVVLDAVDSLGRTLDSGELAPLLAQYAPPGAREELREVRGMLRREALEARLQLELGDLRPGAWVERPFGRTLVQPLGVLLHVTPGNQVGIPLFSALEGLLTGNLNLIKLPHGDRGLTLAALKLLTQREPRLAPWLYAFEVSSKDTGTLERLAALADGAVTWGGDEAVSALRRLAPPGCKLMEWGHRLSFAYVAGYEDREAEWSALARHIVRTGGLLCSSCQVIFLDTDQLEEGEAFCQAFLPLLNRAARERDRDGAAQAALYTHTYRLERLAEGAGDRTWFGEGCSLTLKPDRELELSPPVRKRAGEVPAPGGTASRPAAAEGEAPDGGPAVPSGGAGGADRPPGPGGGDPDHPGGGDVPHLPRRGPRRGVFPAAVYTTGRHRNLNISPPGRGGGTKERLWN